jgi:hypothetical protein
MASVNQRLADRLESRLPVQKDVTGSFAHEVFRAAISRSTHINIVEQMLSGTKQDRTDDEM